jgi:HEPN domain-containing protein
VINVQRAIWTWRSSRRMSPLKLAARSTRFLRGAPWRLTCSLSAVRDSMNSGHGSTQSNGKSTGRECADMYAANNPHIPRLLRAARRDEATLEFDLSSEIFGFHAQQAVEKLLKVLITAHGSEFEFTHDLYKLASQLTGLGEAIPPMSLTLDTLTEYAVQTRYDDGPCANTPIAWRVADGGRFASRARRNTLRVSSGGWHFGQEALDRAHETTWLWTCSSNRSIAVQQ